MNMLYNNFSSHSPSRELEYHLLSSLLLMVRETVMREESGEEQKEQELGHLIQSYIDEHYLENISLQDIAVELNMSQYYISHVFKKWSACHLRDIERFGGNYRKKVQWSLDGIVYIGNYYSIGLSIILWMDIYNSPS
jgi:hypothetical protein